MDISAFVRAKKQCLSKVDRSKKGSIDEPIAALVDTLNASDHFFTTSSCSGRVSVFWQGEEDVGCQRKKEGKWLYISHDPVKQDDLIVALKQCPVHGSAWMKFEAMVIHVQCQSLPAAQNLMAVALQAGLRNSGVVLGRKQRFILGIRSTHGMDVPLVVGGQLQVSEAYIGLLCDLANEKMAENVQRIDRLASGVSPLLGEMQSQPLVQHVGTQGAKKRQRLRQEGKDESRRVTTPSADTDLRSLSSSSSPPSCRSCVDGGRTRCTCERHCAAIATGHHDQFTCTRARGESPCPALGSCGTQGHTASDDDGTWRGLPSSSHSVNGLSSGRHSPPPAEKEEIFGAFLDQLQEVT